MKRKSWLLCLCCLMLALPAAHAQQEAADPVDAYVDKAFRGSKTVGGSVVILSHGEVVYARDYGYRDQRRRLPVDENTFFKTASVTKMVSGIGLMHLVDEGVLDLDQDISEYFGYKIANGYFPKVPLTLRQLMSHTSSVSEGGGYSSIHRKVREMLDAKLDRRGNFNKTAPGSAYKYSNFGAGLAGAIAEAATGKSINAVMQDKVFAPLGMEAAYSASLLSTPENVSSQYKDGQLHRAAAGQIKKVYEDTADPEMHFRTTVGDLWIRSRDMARLAALLCGDGSEGDVRILSRQSVLAMRQEQMTLGKSVTGPSPYGLFVEHNDTLLPDRMVYGHQGMSQGAILNVYFEPDSQFVFVLFSNGGSMQRTNRIGKLARNLFGYFWQQYGQ
ncbi:MAG: serine hydrolase [Clostridiales bacterium]|nr:serine hydrolase [Clostridiales bacterium]